MDACDYFENWLEADLVKLEFFKRTAPEQALIIRETAARRGLLPVMVEKDFWVSWTLAVLFAHPEFGGQLVFKGGTSLSKVFGVIERFSEDIDLSVGPEFLDISEASMEAPGSRKQIETRMKELETACINRIRKRFLPELEKIAVAVLGRRAGGAAWMEFEVDATTHSPAVLFNYPSVAPTGYEYLRRFVKMEFGSLTDQRPVGTHAIRPWLAEEFPKHIRRFSLPTGGAGTRTDILGREPRFCTRNIIATRATLIRDRFSRHYSDMAAAGLDTPLLKRALARRIAAARGGLEEQIFCGKLGAL